MGEQKIKFVVVGAGHIGQRHAFMINANPYAELIGIVDSNISQKEILETNFKTTFYNGFEHFLSLKIQADIVCICTPNGLHASQSIKCLVAGYHVVCEKPMALTVEDCEEIISTSTLTNRKFFCVTQNRYSPPAQWLYNMVSNKLLGEIYLVQVTGYWNRDERYYGNGWKGTKELDGGTLFTQFSHFVDTLHWLLGEIKVENAILKNFSHENSIDFEDTGIFNFSMPAGGIGNFSYSTSVWDKNMQSTIAILGEKGTIKVGGQYMEEIVYCHVKDYKMETLKPRLCQVDLGKYSGAATNHYFLIEDVISALKDKPNQLASTMDCLNVVKTIRDVYTLGSFN